jgi:hypothetical protein
MFDYFKGGTMGGLAITLLHSAIAASNRPTNFNLMAIEELHLQVFSKTILND